jgi:hypothetical protein
MSVLVFGCGRSGTNLVLESLRQSKDLSATKDVEDKMVFLKQIKLHPEYLSKCDTFYAPTGKIAPFMDRNPSLKVVFCIREPRDMMLSKMYRGLKGMDGNTQTSKDATPNGLIEDLEHMDACYDILAANFSDRLFLVRMEAVILSFEKTMKEICRFCEIDYNESFRDFQMRNKHKAARYKRIDKDQVDIWSRRATIYGGYFNGNKDIEVLAKEIEPLRRKFGYA